MQVRCKSKKNAAIKPDKISVEFGVQVTGEFSAIVAKTSTDISIKVAIKWANDK